MKKLENKASVRIVFDDGASLTWSIKPGSPAALDRNEFINELMKFLKSVSKPSPEAANPEKP